MQILSYDYTTSQSPSCLKDQHHTECTGSAGRPGRGRTAAATMDGRPVAAGGGTMVQPDVTLDGVQSK